MRYTVEAASDAIKKNEKKIHFDENQQKRMETETNLPAKRRRNQQQFISDVPFVIGAHPLAKEFNLVERILIFFSYALIAIFFPLSLFFTIKTTQEYE